MYVYIYIYIYIYMRVPRPGPVSLLRLRLSLLGFLDSNFPGYIFSKTARNLTPTPEGRNIGRNFGSCFLQGLGQSFGVVS